MCTLSVLTTLTCLCISYVAIACIHIQNNTIIMVWQLFVKTFRNFVIYWKCVIEITEKKIIFVSLISSFFDLLTIGNFGLNASVETERFNDVYFSAFFPFSHKLRKFVLEHYFALYRMTSTFSMLFYFLI